MANQLLNVSGSMLPPNQISPRRVVRALWKVTALAVLLGAGCQEDPASPADVRCGDSGVLCTVWGTGVNSFGGEGAPPDQVSLYWPIDIAMDTEARLLVLDWNNFRVRRLDHDGRVRTILGTGFESEDLVNGTPALQTSLHHSFSMSVDGAGNLYLAGNHTPVILQMDPDELVWTIAGSPEPGYAGDGGPAVDASLDVPCGVAVPAEGYPIYLADTANHCIRAIDSQGIIRTIAGDGQIGAEGDGGPAANARLHSPYRIRLDDATGDLYIADVENHRIRRIDTSGIITTVAGNGVSGFSGDGGLATEASLRSPLDMRVGPDRALYIADTGNHRIRRVDTAGVITTVVGSGVVGTSRDALVSGSALSVNLHNPAAILFDPDGNLFIADTYSSVVRRVLLVP